MQLYIYIAVAFLLGIIIGSLIFSRVIFKHKKIGTLVINDQDETTTTYRFEMDVPFDDIPKNEYVSLKIRKE